MARLVRAQTLAHISDSDLRAQVRGDLGLDGLGYKATAAMPVLTQAMVDDGAPHSW